MEPVTLLLGPLAGPECRRALARGWLIAARALAGAIPAIVVLALVWYWWLIGRIDPEFDLTSAVRMWLATVAMMMLTVVVVMAPAVLAGSLAGDRDRGVLALFLATTASPREIVLGRLAGKLSQVGMILLAGIPALTLLAAWNDLGAPRLAALVLLLAGVGLGGGGMAVLASVVSRRGRDALLAVYLFTIVLLLAPLAARLGLPVERAEGLGWLNPYQSLARLIWDNRAAPALASAGLWAAMGLVGSAVAAWRLRPSCLPSDSGGRRRRAGRRWRVPEIGERPMLWKELYIERVGTLGRFGRWLGWIFTLAMGGGSLGLTAVVAWSLFWAKDPAWSDWASARVAAILNGTGLLLGWLIQWAIGLRAAVSIAAERERATWDALLTSPLEPGEIVGAKLYGSLFALRWMLGAAVLAWVLGAVVGAVTPGEALGWLAHNAVAGAFMAAVGVRCSLALPTATRAMTWTIGAWLASMVIVPFLAGTILAVAGLLYMAFIYSTFWLNPSGASAVFPGSFRFLPVAWPIVNDVVTALLTVLIVVEARLRFDRLAGRMAGGAVDQAVDAMIHGAPGRPVRLDAGPGPKRPLPEVGRPDGTMGPPVPVASAPSDHPSLETGD
jgi:ABC-type Na+ efflux pump permease subunit